MQKLTIIGEQEEESQPKYDGSREIVPDRTKMNDSPDASHKRFQKIKVGEVNIANTVAADVKPKNDQELRDAQPSTFKEKEKSASQMNQKKRHKSKHIKKILKERLNIDCLRMLCPDEEDLNNLQGPPGQDAGDNKGANLMNSNHLNDSYHVLMREIGIEQQYDLSQSFLDKNGTAQREQLNSFTEMFSVRDLLGVGAFGVVLLVKNRFTKEKSALKIIAKENLSERAQKILKNESTIMQTMKHPSVVALKRIFENQKFIILEMELIPGGQLKRLFKQKDATGSARPLSDLEASKVMKDLLKGVAYVHARDIVHRDLKPENILMKNESEDCFEVKIVDFGLSAEQNWRKATKDRAGTPLYMAPEQVIGKGYSKKIDLWACGIIAYQLLTCGQHPFYQQGEDYYKKLKQIETHPLEFNFSASFTPLAKDFFLNLCCYPPSQRYDSITALQHPWITRNEKDEIPLNSQQELSMLQSETQLRKAMRLAFFASLVKMRQSQSFQQSAHNSNAGQGESSSEYDRAMTAGESRSLHSPCLILNSSPLKVRELGRRLHSNQQLIQTASTSTETQISDKHIIGNLSSAQAQLASKYDHDSFLERDSFASYKQLLFQQSEVQKQSTESTLSNSPKRYRSPNDKQYNSQNSFQMDQDKFVMPHNNPTVLTHPKQSASSSPIKRNRVIKKQKTQSVQKQQQQQQLQMIPIQSPFRITQENLSDSVTGQQLNFNTQQIVVATTNQHTNHTTMNLLNEAVGKQRKSGGAHTSFMQTTNGHAMIIDGTTHQLIGHIQDDRFLLPKQNSGGSQRDQGDSIILPIASATQSKQFSYQHSQSQNRRPGRNLVHVKSPMGSNAVKEWDHTSISNSMGVNNQQHPCESLSASLIDSAAQNNLATGNSMVSRKSKMLARQKMNSIEQETNSKVVVVSTAQNQVFQKYQGGGGGSSKLAIAGQQTLTNRKQGEFLAGQQKVVIKDSLRAEGGSFVMVNNNNKTMSSEINPFELPLKRESSHSLINISPRDKIKVTTTVMRKNTSKKPRKPKNFEMSAEAFHSPQKQGSLMSTRPLQPHELLMLAAATPSKQQSEDRSTTGITNNDFICKIGRQGSHLRATHGTNGLGENGDYIQSPSKKSGTKSSKKRAQKKNKTNDQAGGQNGSKSLQRQTTFELQSMNGRLICGKDTLAQADQKIDWLKLAKDERTIAGSKLLTQATELSALGQPLRINPVGQFSYQGQILLKHGDVIKPHQQQLSSSDEQARTYQKGFKGSRKATKSPIVNVNFVGNQGSLERELSKKKFLDTHTALISGQQVGSASVSAQIGNMMQLNLQSPEQHYHRQSGKHKSSSKKQSNKKMLREGDVPSQTLHNGILSSNSEQFKPMWPAGEFIGMSSYHQKNVPIKNFYAGSHLDQAQQYHYPNHKTTSRAAVMSILSGTPELRQKMVNMSGGETSNMKVVKVRSDLDDIQSRLRPRNYNYQHQVTQFDGQSDFSGLNPNQRQNVEAAPKRQNTTSGIVKKHQEVGLALFGTQQEMFQVPIKQASFEHMSAQ